MITLTLPLRLPNPLNNSQGMTRGGNIARSSARKKIRLAVRNRIRIAFLVARVHWLDVLPVSVQLTRISSGTLDAWDGLPASLKPVVDGIADAFELPDSDARFTWLPPKQEKAKRGVYGCMIQIETRAT